MNFKEITVEIKIDDKLLFMKSVEVPQLEIDGTEHICSKDDIERAVDMLIEAFKHKLYRDSRSDTDNPFIVQREAA